MAQLTYQSYSDPSHGWVKVKRSEVMQLGIGNKISSCSYERNQWVYLEEDCDLTLFIEAKEKTLKDGQKIIFRNHTAREKSSKIRSYDSYFFSGIDRAYIAVIVNKGN